MRSGTRPAVRSLANHRFGMIPLDTNGTTITTTPATTSATTPANTPAQSNANRVGNLLRVQRTFFSAISACTLLAGLARISSDHPEMSLVFSICFACAALLQLAVCTVQEAKAEPVPVRFIVLVHVTLAICGVGVIIAAVDAHNTSHGTSTKAERSNNNGVV